MSRGSDVCLGSSLSVRFLWNTFYGFLSVLIHENYRLVVVALTRRIILDVV